MTDPRDLADVAPANEGLAQLSQLATDLYLAEVRAAECAEVAKEANENVRRIAEGLIPDLMAELGIEEFKTTNGIKLKINPSYRASILKARREEAFAWLDENGEGSMIKHSIVAGFARDQDDEASSLMERLEADGFNVKDEEKVESSTLRAWVKRMLEEGKMIPMDLFGASKVDIAKITARPEEMFGE
tara:strand:- start:15206 stop:15769 length:564 start_codon:yes stop_codon:yes gene_type:complete